MNRKSLETLKWKIMEVKKSPKADLEGKKTIFLEIGFVIALGILLSAFNWKTNTKVEEGFVKFLLPFYANTNAVESSFEIQKFVREVRSGDYSSFFRRLQSFFADTTYEVIRDQELHYENVLFIVFKLVGFYAKVEYHTSEGRIDLVLQTDKFIYIMEFKLNGTAEDALQQINDKNYVLPFEMDGRKLFKIGVNFSAETRNIEKWIVETKN